MPCSVCRIFPECCDALIRVIRTRPVSPAPTGGRIRSREDAGAVSGRNKGLENPYVDSRVYERPRGSHFTTGEIDRVESPVCRGNEPLAHDSLMGEPKSSGGRIVRGVVSAYPLIASY